MSTESSMIDPNETFLLALPSHDHATRRKVRVGYIIMGLKRLVDIGNLAPFQNVVPNLIGKV